jgi:hypothetical protein
MAGIIAADVFSGEAGFRRRKEDFLRERMLYSGSFILGQQEDQFA